MDSLSFLFSLERLGMKFGLENISRLCAALGHPERAFRSIVIAGTNGKGSVTAMTETALRAGGHRAARYTSPHLVRLEERFVIDGREVGSTDLADAAARVRQTASDLLATGEFEAWPTFFECTTAIGFELFRRAGVEIAVLEVGMGGRLDATNVVTPIATVITSIALDHQAQLGYSIESIAREKAGIIKHAVPIVCGPLPAVAEAVVREVAAGAGARVVRALDAVAIARRDAGVAHFRSERYRLDDVSLALRGRHQLENAAVTVALLEELERLGIRIGADAVRSGLSAVSWPGRLESVTVGGTEVLLDAAHNPAGAGALREYLAEIRWTDTVLVFGAMSDKDVLGMLQALAPMCRAVVCTTAASPRAMPAAELADIANAVGGWDVRIEPAPAAALRRARQLGSRLVVAGSIFLIGPLRDTLR